VLRHKNGSIPHCWLEARLFNLLYVGMWTSNFNKLQRLQNRLARVVLHRGKYDHILPGLADFRWLPVKQQVTFKLSTIIFNIKRSNQPSYLCELLYDYEPPHSLRSTTEDLLRSECRRTILSSRFFRYTTTNAWNWLPNSVCYHNSWLETLLNLSYLWANFPHLRITYCYIRCYISFILLTYSLTYLFVLILLQPVRYHQK